MLEGFIFLYCNFDRKAKFLYSSGACYFIVIGRI